MSTGAHTAVANEVLDHDVYTLVVVFSYLHAICHSTNAVLREVKIRLRKRNVHDGNRTWETAVVSCQWHNT